MRKRNYPAHAVLVELPARLARGEAVDLEAIEREFFDQLKNGNGTYKTTNKFRLDEVDRALIPLLLNSGPRELEVLDFAASSGVTSLCMLETLRASGFKPHMTISDLTAFAYFVAPARWFRALVDRKSTPLEFEIFSKAIRMRPKKIDFVTGGVFVILAARAFYNWLAMTRPFSIPDPANGQQEREGRGRIVKVALVSNEVRLCRDISVVEDDVMAADCNEMVRKFDVIRAANILQYCYFDEAAIRLALSNLKRRLKGDGAWLIIGRTHDLGVNHASVFRLENGRFIVKARVRQGSEVEELVLAV